MNFAPSPVIERADLKLSALRPSFVRAFEHASERRLRVLYDVVASTLSESFREFAAAATDQIEVLKEVAALVGLEGVEVDTPLDNEDSEALAQRIAWRSTARWAVLSLLWSLVEHPGQPLTSADWAQVARNHDGKRPRSESSLPPADEPLALALAANALANTPAVTQGTGMALLDVPVVVGTSGDGGVVAIPVRPIALVETSNDWSPTPIELSTGDRVLIAGGHQRVLSLQGEFEASDDSAWTLTSAGSLDRDSGMRAVGVVRGCALLFEG